MNTSKLATILALGLILGANAGLAQQRGNQEGRRRMDPEQMRAQMADRMKENLKVSDEEWQVIQPLLDNVMTKQRAASTRGGMRGGAMGRRGGQQGGRQGGPQAGPQGGTRPGGDAPAVEAPAEIEALRTALESESTSADEIKAKLDALRKQRASAQAELKKARDDLRGVLTQRQEAQLVLTGILD